MKTTFRQGIISAPSNYINFSNNVVNINVDDSLINLSFADGSVDYLFSENEDISSAWGPFTDSTTRWLYWDIDTTSGLRTFGSTKFSPQYGSTNPTTASIDQHFFNTTSKQMLVWDGFHWNRKIRLFAGQLQNNATLILQNIGASQVGLIGSYDIGYILYDKNNSPVTRSNKNFLTTTDKVHTQFDINNAYRIDAYLEDAIAYEAIPAYYAVCWKGANQLGIASYINYQYPCVGISVEAIGKNNLIQFVTKGFVTNYNNWNFSEPAGTSLFIGSTGEITTTVPPYYSLQKIGHIVSPDTIFVNVQEQVLIENDYPTPSPSVSLTISSTSSPTPTISPTPTGSMAVSISQTPASSISATTPT